MANDNIHWQDLVDYLAGEAPLPVRVRIERWLDSDPDNQQMLSSLRRLWTESEKVQQHVDVDVDEAWSRLHTRVGMTRQHGEDRRPKRAPARPRAVGIFGRSQFARVFAVLLLMGTAAYAASWIDVKQDVAPASSLQEITTDVGQRAGVQLVDGSSVKLNVDSRLTFESGFTSDRREVNLEGEAYFDVARDENRPFIIHAGGATVRVLGTSFSVRTYPEEKAVEVIVSEGLVSVATAAFGQSDTLQLRAGHRLVALGDSIVVQREGVNLQSHYGWIAGRLVFRDTPFERVAAELQRWYHLQIELALAPEQVDRLNASFGDEPLSEILNTIAAALDLEYDRSERQVTFYRAQAR